MLTMPRSPDHRFARCAAPRFTPPLLRRFIPTALTPTFTFYAFYYAALIRLTDYRLGFNRRLEIGDITTVGSYY